MLGVGVLFYPCGLEYNLKYIGFQLFLDVVSFSEIALKQKMFVSREETKNLGFKLFSHVRLKC